LYAFPLGADPNGGNHEHQYTALHFAGLAGKPEVFMNSVFSFESRLFQKYDPDQGEHESFQLGLLQIEKFCVFQYYFRPLLQLETTSLQ
jgi:hypothetical protein